MKINLFVLFLFLGVASANAAESVYTDLSEKYCPVIQEDKESGATRQLCPGVGGYNLVILTTDGRESINIISPEGIEHELNFREVITAYFSSLGDKAEWRVTNNGNTVTPVALIVRVKAYEDVSDPQKATSYLSVTKITSKKICVTDKIAASPYANDKAQKAADASGSKECLSPL